MRDEDKSKEQLLDEIKELRNQLKSHPAGVRDSPFVPGNEISEHSEEIFHQITEFAGVGIGVYDVNYRALYFNALAQSYMGCPMEMVLGKTIWEIFPGPAGEIYKERSRLAVLSDKPLEFEDKVEFPSGVFWFLSKYNRILDPSGKVFGFSIMSVDISEKKRINHEMEQANFNLNESQRLSHTGSWESETAAGKIWWSEEMFRIHGLKPDADPPGPGNGWPDYVHPDDRDGLFEAIEKAKSDPSFNYDVKYRIHRFDDGQERQLHSVGHVEFNDDGTPNRFFGIILDITEQEKAKKALKESEALFHQLFNVIRTGVAIYEATEDGEDFTFVDINNAGAALSQVDRDTIVGKPLSVAFPGVREFGLFDVLKKVHQTGEVIHLPLKVYQDERIKQWVENTVYRLPNGHIVSVYEDTSAQHIAEESLRASEHRFRGAFDFAGSGMAIVSSQGEFLKVNNAVCDIFGYEPEEMCSVSFKDITHPDDLEKSIEQFSKVLNGEIENYVIEKRYIHKTGRTIWGILSAAGIRDQEDKVTSVITHLIDVTDRVSMEKEIRRNERLFRKVFELLPVGMWLADKDGRLLEGNPEGVRIWGGSPLVPQEEYSVFKARRLPSGEEIAPDDWALAHTVREGVTISGELIEIDAFDGEKRTVLNYTAPVLDENGEIMAAIVVNSDITELKRSEKALLELQEMLASAERIANLGAWKWDFIAERGAYSEQWSKIHGTDKSEMTMDELMTFAHPGDTERVDEALKKALSGSKTYDIIHRIIRGDNRETRWVHSHADLIEDAEGNPLLLMGTAQDITEQKRRDDEKIKLEEQLRQSQKMEAIGQLAGGVAHDFNNFLTAITGFAQLLIDDVQENDPMRKDLEEILKASQTATTLTQQLLAFSRKQIIAPRVLNLNKVIDHSRNMIGRLIGEDIELIFSLDENLWRVKLDPGQVDQVLVNLAVNSRDAMPRGGRLAVLTGNITLGETVRTGAEDIPPGNYVLLSISDSGNGIPEDKLGRIFEPFFTTKEAGKGTGLGLSTVYGIVKQNYGYIDVNSEPGKGTCFEIYIPRVEAESDFNLEVEEKRDFAGSETIILVEDQDMVRKLAHRVLTNYGYHVLSADDPGHALLLCEKHSPDINLLLTDVVMPQMGGKELYQRLSKIAPQMSVLYMSGYTEATITERGELEKGTNFIQKPFRPKGLVFKVRQVLDK